MNNTYQKAFSERLKSMLLETKTTHKKFSENTGINIHMVSRYARGGRGASAETVIKAAKYFNLSTDYLFGLSDFRNVNQELDRLEEVNNDLLKDNVHLLEENTRLKYRIYLLEKQLEVMTLSFGGKANET